MIDPALHQATLKGEEHAGQVLSREQLYGYVWSQDVQYNVYELVKAHIKALCRILTPTGKEYIKNVWGIGYRFSLDDEEQP